MAQNWSNLTNFFEICTYLIAWGTFLFTLWRYFSENPILRHHVYRCYHYYEERDPRSSLIVDMIVDNVGERSTTIKAYELKKMTSNEHLDKALPTRKDLVQIKPHESKLVHLGWNFRGIELPTEQIPVKAIVHHTHGRFSVSTTSKHRDDLSDWEMEGIPKVT